MKTSARNQLSGTVVNVHKGAVNDEIQIVLDNSNTQITSIITSASTRSLGLEPGKKVVALIKAPWVILVTDMEGVKFSARNQLPGTIVSISNGAVNDEVRLRLDSGEVVTAVITHESAKEMAIEAGTRATALVKASHIILGAKV